MFHKIKSVKPTDNFILDVTFINMEKKSYDLKPLIESEPAFISLTKDINKYNKVQVDPGGYGISWDDDLDLSSEEIWYNGISV